VQGQPKARPTGFEPVTFGFVGRANSFSPKLVNRLLRHGFRVGNRPLPAELGGR
jgi:hypothetical protein